MAMVDIASGTNVAQIDNGEVEFAVMIGYAGQAEFVLKRRYIDPPIGDWEVLDEFDDHSQAHAAMLAAYNRANGHSGPKAEAA